MIDPWYKGLKVKGWAFKEWRLFWDVVSSGSRILSGVMLGKNIFFLALVVETLKKHPFFSAST